MNHSMVTTASPTPLILTAVTSAQATEPASIESGYIHVEGARIFYVAAGQGPVLFMTHDGTLHRETWNAQFIEFAKRYRVVSWDRRGYGRSDVPTAPYSDLNDMLLVFQHLQIERAILVACSAGGLLSLHFALDHPEKVSALVLVGPIVSGLGFSEHFIKRGGRPMPDAKASIEEKIDYWVADPWLVNSSNVDAKRQLHSLLTANPQDLSIPVQFIQWPTTPALPRLSQIKLPTLLIVGESDIPDVHAHVGAIQAGIAGSKRVVLMHSGHLAHIEVPQEFNSLVLNFLDAIK
jgi:pimeloyl-ACP methyl ester carboxylesterase